MLAFLVGMTGISLFWQWGVFDKEENINIIKLSHPALVVICLFISCRTALYYKKKPLLDARSIPVTNLTKPDSFAVFTKIFILISGLIPLILTIDMGVLFLSMYLYAEIEMPFIYLTVLLYISVMCFIVSKISTFLVRFVFSAIPYTWTVYKVLRASAWINGIMIAISIFEMKDHPYETPAYYLPKLLSITIIVFMSFMMAQATKKSLYSFIEKPDKQPI